VQPAAVLLLPSILLLIAADAVAGDLSKRIAEAKAESATTSGVKYDEMLDRS
jgi:hypothetical protein